MVEKYNKLTTKQLIILSDKLRQVCHFDTVTNYAVYDEGWSDQRIVDESNMEYSLANVKSLRGDTIGILRKPRKPSDNTTIIQSFEERLERLENWARGRPIQPFGKPVGSGK